MKTEEFAKLYWEVNIYRTEFPFIRYSVNERLRRQMDVRPHCKEIFSHPEVFPAKYMKEEVKDRNDLDAIVSEKYF